MSLFLLSHCEQGSKSFGTLINKTSQSSLAVTSIISGSPGIQAYASAKNTAFLNICENAFVAEKIVVLNMNASGQHKSYIGSSISNAENYISFFVTDRFKA